MSHKLGFAADSTGIVEENIENGKKDSVFDIDTLPYAISGTKLKTPNFNADCINVNTATDKQLISLHGIGPVLAGRIVDYRKKNGKFKNAFELIKVKGIGKGKLQKIKERICF
ncbi:MAG: ComEA family DNA-binding protein [Chitinispirillia bacterium]